MQGEQQRGFYTQGEGRVASKRRKPLLSNAKQCLQAGRTTWKEQGDQFWHACRAAAGWYSRRPKWRPCKTWVVPSEGCRLNIRAQVALD